jgi:hypothetical protein
MLRNGSLTGSGMRSTPTSALDVMLILSPLHLFIKQEARQANNGLLRKWMLLYAELCEIRGLFFNEKVKSYWTTALTEAI